MDTGYEYVVRPLDGDPETLYDGPSEKFRTWAEARRCAEQYDFAYVDQVRTWTEYDSAEDTFIPDSELTDLYG